MELQLALEVSMLDLGRNQQSEYPYASSSGAGGSSSGFNLTRTRSVSASDSLATSSPAQNAPTLSTPTPSIPSVPAPVEPAAVAQPTALAEPVSVPAPAHSTSPLVITRVRALHSFETVEDGELAFKRGDIINVVDHGDWWHGQLKGKTGIFPVNYVVSIRVHFGNIQAHSYCITPQKPISEPAVELAEEAKREAAVLAQAANFDKLLTLLRSLDPAKDNLTEHEEIQVSSNISSS